MSLSNLKLVILQPTSFCNLNCSYCYLPDRRNTARMSMEVLEESIKKILTEKRYGLLEFVYHAGEPLSVGQKFYEDVINHVIQTNGIMINDYWAEFFKKIILEWGLV